MYYKFRDELLLCLKGFSGTVQIGIMCEAFFEILLHMMHSVFVLPKSTRVEMKLKEAL